MPRQRHSVSGTASEVAEMLDSGTLDAVSGLELESKDKDYRTYQTEALLTIFRADRLGALRQLHLFHCRVGDEAIACLGASPFLPHLESLRIVDCHMTADHVRTLARSRGIGNLKELDISGNPEVGDQGIRWLVKTRRLRRLQTLAVDGCELTADAVLALAKWPCLASVKSLNLSYNNLGRWAVPILGLSSFVKNLRQLYLEDDIDALIGAKAAMQALPEVRKALREVEIVGL